MQRTYVNPTIKQRTLIALTGLMLIGSVAGATTIGGSNWLPGFNSAQAELNSSGTGLGPLTGEATAFNQNPRQNSVTTGSSVAGVVTASTGDAANQNPRQNPVTVNGTSVVANTAGTDDAANQNPRQNPVAANSAIVGESTASTDDATNQNLRQNPAAASD